MVITFILAIAGFANAAYLYFQHKREVETGQKMYCLIGGDCGAVVGSKYGQTFGIKNELIGMTYYFLLGIYSLVYFLFPQLANSLIIVIKLLVIAAALFSLYLLFIQSIILKKFCSWCLIAIFINLLIFYLLNSLFF